MWSPMQMGPRFFGGIRQVAVLGRLECMQKHERCVFWDFIKVTTLDR